MPDVHALFSPSSSERLIHCPPSLLLGEEVGVKDDSSDYSREGTEAHSLCEFLLKTALGKEKINDPRPSFKYYSDEMEQCAQGYCNEVLGIYEQLKQIDPETLISVEQRIDFSEYAEDAFGTSDCIILGNRKLIVIDYKHGKGVPVSAEGDGDGNAQLKCYGLGAYLAFSPLFDIDEVTLIVYQPRIENFSRFSLTPAMLLEWAEEVLKPAAEMALHGEGDFSSGEWCRFCKARFVCRKRAEDNLALARYDFARPDTLEDDEVNLILGKIEPLKTWCEDVKSYALQRALAGFAWDDWKVVAGTSSRKFTDDEAVAKTVEEAGFDPYKKKLLGILALENMLGKERFNSLLGDYITKSPGKPALVARTDKRQELTTNLSEKFQEE